MKKILVIDDIIGIKGSKEQRSFLLDYKKEGIEFIFAEGKDSKGNFSGGGAIDAVNQHPSISLILLDIMFPVHDRLGISMLSSIKKYSPHIPVVMLTSREEPKIIIECMQKGAADYIVKLPPKTEMWKKIGRFAVQLAPEEIIIGQSSPIQELKTMIQQVAPKTPRCILIQGERGTGKELVAQAFHRLGERRNKPLIILNVKAIKPELMESELFGHEKGAFTGAAQLHIGHFQRADGGIIFLDEIGDMGLDLQGALLRVLEYGTFYRVGGKEEQKVDIQIIAATNKDLPALKEQGLFREDFYDRLNLLSIRTPPLREHREDIPLLAQYFFQKLKSQAGSSAQDIEGIEKEAMEFLKGYSWPGNVRELKNTIESSLIRCNNNRIEASHLPSDLCGKPVKGENIREKIFEDFLLKPGILKLEPWRNNEKINFLMADAYFRINVINAYFQKNKSNKLATLRELFPEGGPATLDRVIYNAAREYPDALSSFPRLKEIYEKELSRQKGKPE